MENEFTFENPEYRKTYWHTCSHVHGAGRQAPVARGAAGHRPRH